MGEFTDKTINCLECQSDFLHSAEEQQHYKERGYTNEPKRCYECRQARKAAHGDRNRGGNRGGNQGGGARELHDVICADCGGAAQVPFKPRGDKDVYCSKCFENHRPQR